jgi:hypothetical protein
MSYATRALAVASALLMGAPTAVLSHTNSIGYVGGGNGAVTFWYGNWHPGTTFNEGTLTLQGINGTNFSPSTVNWTLIQQTMPDGLIPGTNYFTSNGTALVPYDPNVQTSYSWQGVTFTGLSAGDYQFTYNAAGSPTVNWMPMDSVILSSTVSLSAAALSGDANQNGVLDIYETGGTPPPPTLVSSSTVNNVTLSTVASASVTTSDTVYTSSESDGRQNVNKYVATTVTTPYVTTTTTIPVTTDTYSDNSTVVTNGTPVVTTSTTNQIGVSHDYTDYFGRVDQLEVLDGINDGINGLLNHEPTSGKQRLRVFENNRFVQSYNADGYTSDSKIFGGGFEIDVTKGWTLGAQYNRVNINLNGVDSSTQQNKDHFGLFSELRGNTLTLNTNAAIANSNYKYNRNVEGVFNNAGETTGTEWWVSNRLYWHLNKSVKPFVGYTVQNVRRNAYTETGSAESARSVDANSNTTHVGEVGLKLETRFGGKKKDLFGVGVDGAYATDSSYGVTASLDYKEMLFVEGSHGVNNGVTNNSVAAKVKFRF